MKADVPAHCEEIMLVLTGHPGETVMIEPDPAAVGADALAWFGRPMEVWVLRIEGNQVRIGIDASVGLRGEKLGRGEGG